MANPKHKFFRHELTEIEVPRYSNGKEIAFEPSTPELKEGAEKIIKALEARGFLRMSGSNPRSVSFSKPEFCKAAYVGTFVNPFSFRDKVWHWSNYFAISQVFITLSEVYKHNGTAANASFRLSVNWSETKEKPKYVTSRWNGGTAGKLNDYGVEIPSTYETVHIGGCLVKGEEIRKFKPTVSDKVLKNILDKAEAVFNGVEVFDPSIFEVDAKDYHESTHEAWKACMEEMKKAKADA
jgi:hypothetical protein